MGFTVNHTNNATDSEFESYVRLLRQQGVDLGKLPRVVEPGAKRRWLYVWDSQDKAQVFADELKKRTRDPQWEVVSVDAPHSDGPLGPILIQIARRGDGLIFSIHSLSLTMLRSAFPNILGVNSVFIDMQTWNDFRTTQGALPDLVEQVAPRLTGLSEEQLKALGYVVIDDQNEKTLVCVPPGEAVHA